MRLAIIVLVVNMHACVTYSHVGDWYYMPDPAPPMANRIAFALWQSHLQAFFMGALFFLAGYFADRSLTRRGPKAFLAERSLRLGVPTLIYMLIIHPFILLGLNPWHEDFPPFATYYVRYLTTGRFLSGSGPLWFAFALLLFCMAFAGLSAARLIPPPQVDAPPARPLSVRASGMLGLGVVLGLLTFLVRTVQPIGTNVINFQLCFFPQYVVVFGLGIATSRRDALRSLAASTLACRAGWLALFGGPVLFVTVIVLGGTPPDHGVNPYFGGWHFQALGLAMWEQLTGVGLGLGMMAWFSRAFNRDTPLLRWLSDRAFAVYVFHPPILIALTMLFHSLHAGPFLLMALLTATTLVATFLTADLARRLPGLREVL
jgi:hypothetical protein